MNNQTKIDAGRALLAEKKAKRLAERGPEVEAQVEASMERISAIPPKKIEAGLVDVIRGKERSVTPAKVKPKDYEPIDYYSQKEHGIVDPVEGHQRRVKKLAAIRWYYNNKATKSQKSLMEKIHGKKLNQY